MAVSSLDGLHGLVLAVVLADASTSSYCLFLALHSQVLSVNLFLLKLVKCLHFMQPNSQLEGRAAKNL